MTELAVFANLQPCVPVRITTDAIEIEEALAAIGTRYRRLSIIHDLPDATDGQAVLDAYGDEIERIAAEGGYRSADLLRADSRHREGALQWLCAGDEHVHAEDEVRFFVRGGGAFYLHVKHLIYRVTCECGDLLAIAAGVSHWFDAGSAGDFVAIRLYNDPSGWIPRFTGDAISAYVPRVGV
ncbi:MAG: cupin [Burkholderiales bacterium]|nr:cupin [Burkholderiales bacterium]